MKEVITTTQKFSLKKAFIGGYKCKQVQECIASLQEEVEDWQQKAEESDYENSSLKARLDNSLAQISSLKDELEAEQLKTQQELEEIEKQRKEVLYKAETKANKIIEEAQHFSAAKIKATEEECKRKIAEAERKILTIRKNVQHLDNQSEMLLDQLMNSLVRTTQSVRELQEAKRMRFRNDAFRITNYVDSTDINEEVVRPATNPKLKKRRAKKATMAAQGQTEAKQPVSANTQRKQSASQRNKGVEFHAFLENISQ